MNPIILSGVCRRCAECCKNFPYVELSAYEIDLLEQVTGLPFDMFTNPKGKTVEEYFLKFRENGHCYFLKENNGRYSCCVYESRPEICKKFPSKPVQKQACYEILGKLSKNTSDPE